MMNPSFHQQMLDAGYRLIPLREKQKRPAHDGWGENNYTLEDLGKQVGLVIEREMVDVDLDWPEMRTLATDGRYDTMVWGRKGRVTHLVYRSSLPEPVTFRLPKVQGAPSLALANANLARDANGNIILNSGAPSGHTISRADARDPVKYRVAKEAAAKAGETLRISDGGTEDPTRRNTLSLPEIAKTKTISLTDDHYKIEYVRADHMAGNGFVSRRLEAERRGVKVVPWRTPEDLPEHMQAKLHLMERAHDAQTDS